MNEIQIFENARFGQVRTLDENGKTLFCGSDVAKALGYSNAPDALRRHCKGIVKRDTPTNSGVQQMSFIPEGDIYRLAAKSELPGADEFERWIFDEVLPSIRKHGGYLTPEKVEEALLNPDTLIRLATDLKTEREKRMQLEAQAQKDKPKVLFADAVSVSEDGILIGALAKIIKQNGYDIGQKRLFEWMRSNDFLMKGGRDYNLPTQKAMDLQLFKIKERTISNPDGSVRITKTVLVTGKGQQYFINRFLQ